MLDRERIIETLRAQLPMLKERYKVSGLDLFGSYARSDQKDSSDIDLLVEFSGPVDLFDFIALENHLAVILGSKVDLVMKDTLKPRIKDNILRQALHL